MSNDWYLSAAVPKLVFPEQVGESFAIKVPDDRDRLISIILTKISKTRLSLKFPYNFYLKEEVKHSLSDSRWDNDKKHWHCKDDPRTRFVFEYLCYGEIADIYNKPLTSIQPTRNLYKHQTRLFNHAITCRRVYWMAEMGVGKTLTVIELMEWIKSNITQGPANDKDKFVVAAPPNVLQSWNRELAKWECNVMPTLVSLYSLKKFINNKAVWPYVLIVDESSKVKNEQAQITKNTKYLADSMEAYWGYGTFVITMTGSPDPKQPSDVYMQAEIARPGYLREKNSKKFQHTVSMMEKHDGPTGSYHRIVGYKDGTCSKCNKDLEWHDFTGTKCRYTPKVKCKLCEKYHTGVWSCGTFKPENKEVDEVERMGERLSGLTICVRKKDCLDLPDKQYIKVQCSPPRDMLKAAELVQLQQSTVIGILSKLRQLSDGFLYQETNKVVKDYTEIPNNPKRLALGNILEEYRDVGETKLIIYAGFKASIDICVDEAIKKQWHVIRADSRGYQKFMYEPAYIEPNDKFFCETDLRVCYIAHPGTAGHGKNLQVAKAIVYYSNDFNFENRIQSEDRAHRMGMRESLSIYDLFCLKTDEYVYENLLQKKSMQDLSMHHVKNFSLRASR